MSANGCATEIISALTDLILRPLVPNIPSYIKDTGHFLQLVRNLGNDIPENTLLWKHRPWTEVLIGEPSNQSILSLLQMVLEFNNFQFNGKHYLQVGGTAMGTRVTPTLTNMFMGNFERQHVYTYKLQPLIWARFKDDIFLLWTHGREKLDQFIHHLNDAHSNIKFTSEISDTQVPFLDTLVIKSGNTIYTDLYTKPTDANNFLHFDSAHPPHIVKRESHLDYSYAYAEYVPHNSISTNMALSRPQITIHPKSTMSQGEYLVWNRFRVFGPTFSRENHVLSPRLTHSFSSTGI